MSKKISAEQVLTFVSVSKIRRPQVIDRIDIEESAVRELAESISKQDLLQAPILRPVDDEYEIVAGDRRILAIKLLEWEEVQCVIREMTDKQAAERDRKSTRLNSSHQIISYAVFCLKKKINTKKKKKRKKE